MCCGGEWGGAFAPPVLLTEVGFEMLKWVCAVFWVCWSSIHPPTSPCIPLHPPASPYIPLHPPTSPYIPLQPPTSPYIPLHPPTSPYIPLQPPTSPSVPESPSNFPLIPLISNASGPAIPMRAPTGASAYSPGPSPHPTPTLPRFLLEAARLWWVSVAVVLQGLIPLAVCLTPLGQAPSATPIPLQRAAAHCPRSLQTPGGTR